MANLTKDEVNVLAQRAYDIKAAEIVLHNEAIKESEKYKEFVKDVERKHILKLIKDREEIQEQHAEMVATGLAKLEVLRQEINDLDKDQEYINHRWGIPSYEAVKNQIVANEGKVLFPTKHIRNNERFENKLKSVAVMNKTKTPTEVLEILLTVNEDE
jgi:hypothetical protein